jgi:hypothetical protein
MKRVKVLGALSNKRELFELKVAVWIQAKLPHTPNDLVQK